MLDVGGTLRKKEVAMATQEVFVRKSSGLIRVMSPFSAFVYNVLTMGLIFPWAFLQSPAAFPGSSLWLGILHVMLVHCYHRPGIIVCAVTMLPVRNGKSSMLIQASIVREFYNVIERWHRHFDIRYCLSSG